MILLKFCLISQKLGLSFCFSWYISGSHLLSCKFTILTKYLRHFYVSAQFWFTTSEMELNYHHQKLNVPVALRVSTPRHFRRWGGLCAHTRKKKLIFFYKNSGRAVPMNFFHKKIYLIFLLRGSEFDSDPKHSDKEYIYLIMDILHMIYCVIKALCCKYIVL